MISKIFLKFKRLARRILNSVSSRKKCYVCGKTFYTFTKYKLSSDFMLPDELHMIGSDIDNFGCMYCGSHDRERHLYMYFDALEIWEKLRNASVLHFAPELNLSKKIQENGVKKYIKADYSPKNTDEVKIDATHIPYEDKSFDFIFANHILEHIPDYTKALSEFYRILRDGGIAVIQTPYSSLLKNNFEDENLNTNELRLRFFGQEDHVRVFGEKHFFESIRQCGFNLKVVEHDSLFSSGMAFKYGVNSEESFLLVSKM